MTPQIAVAAQMAALQAKTLAETGIAVPSYYNPSSVNPMKFAEQEKKRKKLWQGKKDGVRTSSSILLILLQFQLLSPLLYCYILIVVISFVFCFVLGFF